MKENVDDTADCGITIYFVITQPIIHCYNFELMNEYIMMYILPQLSRYISSRGHKPQVARVVEHCPRDRIVVSSVSAVCFFNPRLPAFHLRLELYAQGIRSASRVDNVLKYKFP